MDLKKDRLVAGSFTGIIAAIVQAIYGITVKSLGLTDRAFIDFTKMFIMYRNFPGVLADIMGFIGHLGFGAIWGILFAYLIQYTSSRYYYYKAFGYGVFLWLSLAILGTAFDIPLFKEIPPKALLSTLIGALIFAFINAYTLKKIEANR
ncbi:MAG TPA: hypothetical protein VHY08_00390 [Bacillota bacterium]|nr:hypothetical protein [Bacillota bacterium]